MVIGTIGNTHGVSSESAPMDAAIQRKSAREPLPGRRVGTGDRAGRAAGVIARAGGGAGLAESNAAGPATFAAFPARTMFAVRVSVTGRRQRRSLQVW